MSAGRGAWYRKPVTLAPRPKKASPLFAFALVLGGLGTAPMQCKHERDPSLRMEDSAGDALWDLALDFKKKGDEGAARETLRRLVERYPSSRHAAAARAELGPGEGASAGTDAGR